MKFATRIFFPSSHLPPPRVLPSPREDETFFLPSLRASVSLVVSVASCLHRRSDFVILLSRSRYAHFYRFHSSRESPLHHANRPFTALPSNTFLLPLSSRASTTRKVFLHLRLPTILPRRRVKFSCELICSLGHVTAVPFPQYCLHNTTWKPQRFFVSPPHFFYCVLNVFPHLFPSTSNTHRNSNVALFPCDRRSPPRSTLPSTRRRLPHTFHYQYSKQKLHRGSLFCRNLHF